MEATTTATMAVAGEDDEGHGILGDISALWTDNAATNEEWSRLFHVHFIERERGDDLLFFVKDTKGPAAPVLEVYRRGGTKALPEAGSSAYDWRQTLCLNAIMNCVTFSLTVALCRETVKKTLKPIKSDERQLYASPSHRSLDVKSANEVITYPDLYFTIDDFDAYFEDYSVRLDQAFSLELCADLDGRSTVLFTGSISHSSPTSSSSLVTEYISQSGKSQPKREACAWISRADLIFFDINAPNKAAGYVQMALALGSAESSSTLSSSTPTTTSSSSQRSVGSVRGRSVSTSGGFLTSLWSSTTRQVNKTLRWGVGAPVGSSQTYVQNSPFNTFVTYLCMRWDDIIEKVVAGNSVLPRLRMLHRRRQRQRAVLAETQRDKGSGESSSSHTHSPKSKKAEANKSVHAPTTGDAKHDDVRAVSVPATVTVSSGEHGSNARESSAARAAPEDTDATYAKKVVELSSPRSRTGSTMGDGDVDGRAVDVPVLRSHDKGAGDDDDDDDVVMVDVTIGGSITVSEHGASVEDLN